MVLWVIGFLVVIVALLIPILAIVLDSPAMRRFMEAKTGASAAEFQDVQRRLGTLEDEVDDLGQALRTLRDETQFLQRLLESAEERASRKPLPPTSS